MERTTNNPATLAAGLSARLMRCYADELFMRALGHYEMAYWLWCRRRNLRAELDSIFKQGESNA